MIPNSLLLVLGLVGLGLMILVIQLVLELGRRARGRAFLQQFIAFCEAPTPEDEASFTRLLEKSHVMQGMLAQAGALDAPPLAVGDVYLPQQVSLVDTLNTVHEGGETHRVAASKEALLTYIGTRSQQVGVLQKALINPLSWFGIGLKTILLIPVYALQGIGVFSDGTAARTEKKGWFRLLFGISAVAMLLLVAGVLYWGETGFFLRFEEWVQRAVAEIRRARFGA